nr:glycosyltransferase family 1 protein [uncultured Sediminibacterium sp.]
MKLPGKIKVGIDIRDLRVAKTGQKTVMEELCNYLKKQADPDFEFVFLDSSLPIYSGKNKIRLMLEHVLFQYWKQVALPLKAFIKGCDIVFCGDYFAPLIHLRFKTLVTFHDAFFFEYPSHYNKLWLKIFHLFAVSAARKCRYVVTVSDFARHSIHTHSGIPLEKIVTIYNSPKQLQQTLSDKPITPALQTLTNFPYILHVGVLEKRKNIPRLIDAFRLLCENGNTTHHLVLVGKGNGKLYSDNTAQIQDAIEKSGVKDRIICTGYLTDDELSYVYQHANMYVFPSFNEGFGIPILEAFQYNLPVLVANNTALPEVGGDAVLSFDPYNTHEIYQTIHNLIQDPQLRESLIIKGKERLALFSTEKTANAFKSLFKKTVADE